MKNLNELIICSNYYKAKHEYLEMKIAKFKKLQLACGSPIEPIEPEEPEESEPEPDSDVSLFFKNMIVQDNTGKIKRSDSYSFYKKFCKTKQSEPKQKPQFYAAIEKLIGQPIKTNGIYYYKNYSLKSDPLLTFNESVEEFIF